MIDFEYRDRRRSVARVRLLPDLAMEPVELVRGKASFPEPPVDRIEYLLELTFRNGNVEVVADPGNPARAPGPFGDKSVLELDGYAPPAWLATDPPRGGLVELTAWSRPFKTELPMLLWSARGTDPAQELPLLVVHDGPETDEFGSLTLFLDHLVAEERVRPFRAALLQPVARNEHYSASAAYARTLAWDVMPALPAPRRRRWRAGLGASLGALALLHAHHRHPDVFGALFLQSGSFFRAATDPQERGFPRFDRIARFVGKVLRGEGTTPVPLTLTCGLGEENLANNRAVARALGAKLVEVRDAHTWVGWRDAWDPHLADLLAATFR